MADADVDFPCRFHWDILSPFFPMREFEATFDTEFPILRQWRVTFEPLDFQFDRWWYSFSLSNVTFGERQLLDDVIVAHRMRVNISVDGHLMERRRMDNYDFFVGNRYALVFTGSLLFPPLEEIHFVSIEVQLSFRGQNTVNERDEFVPRECDLLQLSEDLAHLFNNPLYFNLGLMSSLPNARIFRVHSYIIRTRWSNFFSVHPAQTIIDGTIVVNISDGILREVLRYMYSDILRMEVILGNMQLRTELFQVIDRYRVHHLYKVFATNSSRQRRVTAVDMRGQEKAFQLDGPPCANRQFSMTVNSNSDHEITFQIRFFLNADVPWFQYILISLSQSNLFVHVRLEIQFRRVGVPRRSFTVHERDYTVRSYAPVMSGPCHFEGNPEVFAEFINGILHGRPGRTAHFINCSIRASDGTTGIMIQAEDGMMGLRSNVERLKILSDHMYEMLMGLIEPDFTLSCPFVRPVDPDSPNEDFYLHKSIFVARIPHWRFLLEDVPEGVAVPDQATCSMISEAFHHFIAYIYAGKVFLIPYHWLNEIQDFAIRGGVRYLSNFLRWRRLAGRDL